MSDSTQDPPCERCRRDGKECNFSTTWRKASPTTGNLASKEQVTLLPGNRRKLDEVASTEMVGLRKQNHDERKQNHDEKKHLNVARARPTYIRVHKKHLLPETLNVYQLPWFYEVSRLFTSLN